MKIRREAPRRFVCLLAFTARSPRATVKAVTVNPPRPVRLGLALLGCLAQLLAGDIPSVWDLVTDSVFHAMFRTLGLPELAGDVYDVLTLVA